MEIRARLLAAGIAFALLGGCATTEEAPQVPPGATKPAYEAAPRPKAAPKYLERGESARMERPAPAPAPPPRMAETVGGDTATAAPSQPKKKRAAPRATIARAPAAIATEARTAATAAAAAPPSADFDADAALTARRDAYRNQLKQAAYTFNPPTPIKVAEPVTVYFWLDPVLEPMRLAEELKAQLLKMRPDESPQAEAGRIDWSPRMRATLTGDDFEITPTEGKAFDGIKDLSAQRRTEWSWDVKARHVGERLPLHLRVWAILPRQLGEPEEVLKLDKLIHVEVTLWWLLDEFWEKYWKWLLGGLGTAIAGAIGAWWKRKQGQTGA